MKIDTAINTIEVVMSEKRMGLTHPERLRWFRNVNIIGAGALVAAGVYIPAFAPAFFTGAAVNVAQATAADTWRNHKLQKQHKIAAAK